MWLLWDQPCFKTTAHDATCIFLFLKHQPQQLQCQQVFNLLFSNGTASSSCWWCLMEEEEEEETRQMDLASNTYWCSCSCLVLLILMFLILLGHPSFPSRSDPLVFLRSSEVGFLLLSCFLCAFFVQKNREIPKWAEVEVVASAFNLLSPYFSVAQNTRVERKERKVQLCVALVEDDGFLSY